MCHGAHQHGDVCLAIRWHDGSLVLHCLQVDRPPVAVRRLLTEAREQLDQLVRTLLQEETIDQDELGRILGLRPETTVEV
jgi:hypothetical protein